MFLKTANYVRIIYSGTQMTSMVINGNHIIYREQFHRQNKDNEQVIVIAECRSNACSLSDELYLRTISARLLLRGDRAAAARWRQSSLYQSTSGRSSGDHHQ